MGKTYVVCNHCHQMNRVEVETKKEPVCGACKSRLPLKGALIEAGDGTFQKLIAKCPIPIVVDVWADWCGPCRSFAPTFKEASHNYAGKVVFVKLDSEKNPQSANFLNIRSIPTVVIFNNGREVTRQSGALPKEQFQSWLNQILKISFNS